MYEFDEDEENHNYWPSVSDLFLTLFVIAIAIIGVVFVSFLPKDNVSDAESLVHGMGSNRDRLFTPVNQLREKIGYSILDKSLPQSRFLDALEATSAETIRKLTAYEAESYKARLYEEEVGQNRKELASLKSTIQSLEASLAARQNELEIALADPEKGSQIQTLMSRNTALQEQLTEKDRLMTDRINLDAQQRQALEEANADLKHQLHDKPPNILISEQREDYRFESGSSEMSMAFVRGLQASEFVQLANEIDSRNRSGRVKVDTLEIIGHTDGSPISIQGNLDQLMPRLLTGEIELSDSLRAGSNNDLGLLRALAVRNQWWNFILRHPNYEMLKEINVRCYSAGPTVSPRPIFPTSSAELLQPDPAARRIEMRLTRLHTSE